MALLLLQGAVDQGFSGEAMALLGFWGVLAWMEWRRVDVQGREGAA